MYLDPKLGIATNVLCANHRTYGDEGTGIRRPPTGTFCPAKRAGICGRLEIMIRVPRRWVEGQAKKGEANIVDNNVITAW